MAWFYHTEEESGCFLPYDNEVRLFFTIWWWKG